MDRKKAVRRMNGLTAAVLALLLVGTGMPAAAEESPGLSPPVQNSTQTGRGNYQEYLEAHAQEPYASETLEIGYQDVTGVTGGSRKQAEYEGREGAVLIAQNQMAEWTFTVPKTGLYHVGIDYLALPGKTMDIEMALSVNGSVPFYEAGFFTLKRVWKDADEIRRDNNGNELKPAQEEQHIWQSVFLWDINGFSDSAISLYLESGETRLSLHANREGLAVAGLRLGPVQERPSYAQLKEEYAARGYRPAGEYYFERQAEKSYRKSQRSIAPVAQYATPSVTPNSPSKIRLNTLGGTDWGMTGGWVEWQVQTEEEGLYQLNFKYLQNYIRGFNVHRRITINGEVPCRELEAYPFAYTNKWRNITLSHEGRPMLLYLGKGANIIRMDVTLGEVSQILQTIDSAVYTLNDLYRKIIKVTGLSPDFRRDYYLEDEIPELLESFEQVAAQLQAQANHIEKMTGVKGGEASLFYQIAKHLRDLIKRPDKIASRLNAFKGNASSLATLILTLREQPLLLDYLSVSSRDYPLRKADAGFFASASFKIQAFLASFFEDYDAIGNVYSSGDYTVNPVEAWVSANDLAITGTSSGRDQMQVLKQLIDDIFVPQHGIPINLSLVNNSTTLTQAILGGQGPDVALIVPKGMPINLAMRGALQDLNAFEGFGKAKKEFYDSAFVSYEFEGGVYAMPESQSFMMMFYRTDIFGDLGLEPPATWEAFYKVIPRIQKENMQVGVGEGEWVFSTLILQRGGAYYTRDWKATQFHRPESIQAFKDWTELYTKYDLPLYFDAFNRFRTGEIPLTFQAYPFYNQLTVAAPEINNLWAMAPLPGTPDPETGKINLKQASFGTGAIMLKTAAGKPQAFEFIRWWTGEAAQAEFGLALEAMMGPAARYATANREAFERLPWSSAESRVLKETWEQAWDIPGVPGNYFISRSITNAFRKVVYSHENPRETLLRYNKDMNNEITRKREELGLD